MVDTVKPMRFDGKVAVVTGASSGMGLAAAEQLGREGARIVAVGRRAQPLEEAADKIRSAGSPAVVTVVADVGTQEGCRACIDAAVEEFGTLHALFANAGLYKPVLLADATEELIDSYVNANLKSVVYCIKYAMSAMSDLGVRGAIVVNSSAMSHIPKSGFEGVGLYAATKAAADMIVRYAAIEGSQAGIRVNAIRPGIVATGILGPGMTEEKWDAFAAAKSLASRAGRPEEIARFVTFLLSEESEFVNASMHDLDGGWGVYSQ